MILDRSKEVDQKGNYVNKPDKFDSRFIKASREKIQEHVKEDGSTYYVINLGKCKVY